MDQKTKLTIIGGVVLLILAAIFITIFYFGRVSKTTNGPKDTGTSPLSGLPTTAPISSPSAGTSTSGSTQGKTVVGQGFTLTYPNNWSVLTCGNSQNFELDPAGGPDIRNVVCETAVKPITVLVVNRLTCSGDTITLGNNKAIKSATKTSTGTNYRWCVAVGNKGLDITHRVSSSSTRATSKDDFSSQVEQVITTIKTSPQGS